MCLIKHNRMEKCGFIYLLLLTLTLSDWDYIESNDWMEAINEMERKLSSPN